MRIRRSFEGETRRSRTRPEDHAASGGVIGGELLGILGELGQLGVDLGGARVVRVAVLVDHGWRGGKLSLEPGFVDAGGHLIGALLHQAVRSVR